MSQSAALAKLSRRGAWLRDATWQAIVAVAMFVVVYLTLLMPEVIDQPTRGQIEVPVTDGLGWQLTDMARTRQTSGLTSVKPSPVSEELDRATIMALVDPIELAKENGEKLTLDTDKVNLRQADAIMRLAARYKFGPNRFAKPFTAQDYADLAVVRTLSPGYSATDEWRKSADTAVTPPADYINRATVTTTIFVPICWLVAVTVLFGIDQWVGRMFAVRRRWRWPFVGAAFAVMLVPIIAYVLYMTTPPDEARRSDHNRVRTVALADPRARLATRDEALAQDPACDRVPTLGIGNCLAARGWYVLEPTGNTKPLDARDTELHYTLAQHAWLNRQPDRLIAHLDKVVPMFLVRDPSTCARLDKMARDAIGQRPEAQARLARFLVDGGDVVRNAMLVGITVMIAGLLVVALVSIRLSRVVTQRLGRIRSALERSDLALG
jgi:hypothetical protein